MVIFVQEKYYDDYYNNHNNCCIILDNCKSLPWKCMVNVPVYVVNSEALAGFL